MDSVDLTRCQYTRLPNGIEHVILLDNSRLAADGLLDFFDRYLTALDPASNTPPLIVLVELRQSGMPPLAYLSRCYQDLLKLHAPKQLRARIAYVYVGGFVMPIVTSIFRLIRNATLVERRFFPMHERAEAEAWLLEAVRKPDVS
jgi:hypothetical protein